MARIADVIKYEGDNNTFIWKHPCEDFNSLTQLIVHESQEAIFFMNGQALDLFGPGRHTLETQNIPKLSGLFKGITGKETPFHCEVYFINKTVQMSIKWGTDSKVRFIEPTMGLPLEIGACGELNLEVIDSRKLLVKLVGTTNGIAWGDSGAGFTKSIQNCFRPLISTAVKANLSSVIKKEQIDLFDIDQHLETISEALRHSIVPGFEEYGLSIPQFYVTNVALPENDPNFRRLRDLHTLSFQTKLIQADTLIKTAQAEASATVVAAERKAELEKQQTETEILRRKAERELIQAQAEAQAAKMAGLAEAEIMAAKGYNQKDVIQAEVQKAYAEGLGNIGANGGSGSSVLGDFVGLGMGLAAAGTVGSKMNNMINGLNETTNETTSTPKAKCAKCGAELPENAKFCLECGEKVVPANSIVCPVCGKVVAKGKFCPECGHKFITSCPKCGHELQSGAKFCPECGEKL